MIKTCYLGEKVKAIFISIVGKELLRLVYNVTPAYET